MSSKVAIRASNLSKCYQIYEHPQDRLKQMIVPRLARGLGREAPSYYREFWAVRDVSFEVRRGEALGVIGRNGSGKSTLLQMICGTVTPTAGGVETAGRVAALLELGAGFNPEFSGRENVYLSASLYGLSHGETDARIDRIAAFADIGAFIDQPVKTYSSGMFVRLAFAVIAHVDADVLVIDEALAVGDAMFTQKCMRFIRRFKESGTLLFVSHDTASVTNLCERALWLHDGAVRAHGSAQDVTKQYSLFCLRQLYGQEVELNAIERNASTEPGAEAPASKPDSSTAVNVFQNLAHSDGFESGKARIVAVMMENESGRESQSFAGGEAVGLRVRVQFAAEVRDPIVGFVLKDRLGQVLFGENTFVHCGPGGPAQADDVLEATFRFDLPLLPNGDYAITAAIASGDPLNHVQHHLVHDALLIKVASDKLRYGLVGIRFKTVRLARVEAVRP